MRARHKLGSNPEQADQAIGRLSQFAPGFSGVLPSGSLPRESAVPILPISAHRRRGVCPVVLAGVVPRDPAALERARTRFQRLRLQCAVLRAWREAAQCASARDRYPAAPTTPPGGSGWSDALVDSYAPHAPAREFQFAGVR